MPPCSLIWSKSILPALSAPVPNLAAPPDMKSTIAIFSSGGFCALLPAEGPPGAQAGHRGAATTTRPTNRGSCAARRMMPSRPASKSSRPSTQHEEWTDCTLVPGLWQQVPGCSQGHFARLAYACSVALVDDPEHVALVLDHREQALEVCHRHRFDVDAVDKLAAARRWRVGRQSAARDHDPLVHPVLDGRRAALAGRLSVHGAAGRHRVDLAALLA